MKICIVALSGLYPAHGGGPAAVAYFLAREFARKGHPTTVLTRTRSAADEAKLTENDGGANFEVRRIRARYDSWEDILPGYLPFKIAQATLEFGRIEADVVLYNSPPVDAGLLLPFVARLRHWTQVAIVHGGLFNELPNVVGRQIFARYRNAFDHVVTVSPAMRELLSQHGFPRETTSVIPDGVDVDLVQSAEPLDLPGEPRILFVGRLAPIKQVSVLVRAFNRFRETYPEAHLYVVGAGPEERRLRGETRALGCESQVHFTGHVPAQGPVYRFYRSCDMFVLPSKQESFGLALLEAMAAGMPVVAASGQGGLADEIMDGRNGFLFPAGDDAGLEQVLGRIWEDAALRRGAADRALRQARERFSWASVSDRYLALIEGRPSGTDAATGVQS